MSVEKLVAEIKKKIESIDTDLTNQEVGRVVESADGIAVISGLSGCQASEMLEFESGATGIALNLENESVGAIILGEFSSIKEGGSVKRTGKVLQVGVGEGVDRKSVV